MPTSVEFERPQRSETAATEHTSLAKYTDTVGTSAHNLHVDSVRGPSWSRQTTIDTPGQWLARLRRECLNIYLNHDTGSIDLAYFRLSPLHCGS